MLMPKASVDKNGFAHLAEYQIRDTRQIPLMQPEPVAEAVNERANKHFRLRVRRFNSGHIGAALPPGKFVGHPVSRANSHCEVKRQVRDVSQPFSANQNINLLLGIFVVQLAEGILQFGQSKMVDAIDFARA